MEGFWVAELHISPKTAAKLVTKHHLDPEDVRTRLVCVKGLQGLWDNDPERGWRFLTEVSISGQTVVVVLYRVEHPMGDAWALGSAYPIT